MGRENGHRCQGHNISLPAAMYEEIDRLSRLRHWTRSQVVREAVRHYLRECRRPERDGTEAGSG